MPRRMNRFALLFPEYAADGRNQAVCHAGKVKGCCALYSTPPPTTLQASPNLSALISPDPLSMKELVHSKDKGPFAGCMLVFLCSVVLSTRARTKKMKAREMLS